MTTTPPSLLERLRRADRPEAWVEFVEMYTPLLYRWARGVGLQDADAADLLQDVFTSMLRTLPTFQYRADLGFRGYLRTVLLNAWRKRRRPPSQSLECASEPTISEPPDVDEAEYRRHLLSQALRRLTPEFEPVTWQAWQQFAVEGKPACQVAEQLDVTVNAVYLAKSRVLRRLREELAGMLD